MTERYVINDNIIEDTLSDDYYHFNDWRDFKALCKRLNELVCKNNTIELRLTKKNEEVLMKSQHISKGYMEAIDRYNELFEENRINEKVKEVLIEFCKSKGHTLEEINEFVKSIPVKED